MSQVGQLLAGSSCTEQSSYYCHLGHGITPQGDHLLDCPLPSFFPFSQDMGEVLAGCWLLTGSLGGPFWKSCLPVLPVWTTPPIWGSLIYRISSTPESHLGFPPKTPAQCRKRETSWVGAPEEAGRPGAGLQPVLRRGASRRAELPPPTRHTACPGQPHKPGAGNTNLKGPPPLGPHPSSKMLQARI